MNTFGVNSRQQKKREVVRLQVLLKCSQMTDHNRAEMLRKIDALEDAMRDLEPELDKDAFADRQHAITENSGLNEIFKSFWFCVSHLTNTLGELEIAGYVQFHVRLSRALGATYDVSDPTSALKAAERDFAHDVEVYGTITREAFNDIVFQIVDLYTEFMDPMYYQSFSWAVLDAIADLEKHPPRFKPLPQVPCIMKLDNEAAMVTAYINAKSEVAKLSIMNQWMERVPEVQKRFAGRRGGGTLETSNVDALIAVTRRNRKSAMANGDSDTDSDPDVDKTLTTIKGNKAKSNNIASGESDEEKNALHDAHKIEDTMIERRYKDHQSRHSGKSYSHESYFRNKKPKSGDQSRSGLATWSSQTPDGRPKTSNRRQSFLLKTTSLAGVNEYKDKTMKRHLKSKTSENITTENEEETSSSLEIASNDNVEANQIKVSAKNKAKITDPYDDEYQEEEVDPEWQAFREHLRLINDHDRAMQRIAAEEQARRDEEVRKQNEDALRFKEARERAEAAELAEKLAKEAAVAAGAQAELDRMLAGISFDRQLLNTPGCPRSVDNLPLAYVKGSAKDGDEAIDEGSQFDITFTERYELDSFFAASAAASIASEMSADELIYVAANAADIAARKAKEEAELAAKASARALKMQDAFEGYEDLQILKALKREHEKAMLRQEMDSITGSSSKISLIRLQDLQKQEMANKIKELQENKVRAAREAKRHDMLTSSINESTKSRENSPELKTRSRGDNKSTTISRISGTSSASVVAVDDHISVLSQFTDGMSLESTEFGTTFNLTEPRAAVFLGRETLGVSHAGSSIIDDYAKGMYIPKAVESQVFEENTMEKKQFPFPHKSYYKVISEARPTASEGTLGTWNHDRASSLNLLIHTKSAVEEDFEQMRMSLLGKSDTGSLNKLQLLKEPRVLPWFANDVKRTRGKTGQATAEKQRELVQPGDIRHLKMLAKEGSPQRNSLLTQTGAPTNVNEESVDTPLQDVSLMSVPVTNPEIIIDSTVHNTGVATPKATPPLSGSATPMNAISQAKMSHSERIKLNNDFISKMVLAAGVSKKEPKQLALGTVSSFRGYDARPVINAAEFGKFVELPHSLEVQSSPVHPNRNFRVPDKQTERAFQIQRVLPSEVSRSEFHNTSPKLDRSTSTEGLATIANQIAKSETNFTTKKNSNAVLGFESNFREPMTDALDTADLNVISDAKRHTDEAGLEINHTGDQTNPSLVIRSYRKHASDSDAKKVIVVCSDKTIQALEPARADPIGPAGKLGADSIEDHPRFRYSGLPAPQMPPPTHYMSKFTHLSLKQNKTGILNDGHEVCLPGTSDSPPFWLPKAVKSLNDPLHHDRSSHINGWNDLKQDLMLRNPNADGERANVLLTLKRQQAYLTRFNDYVTTTKARNSNAEFVNFVFKDDPLISIGQREDLLSFYDKYSNNLPVVKDRIQKLRIESHKADQRKQVFRLKRAAIEEQEFV